MNLKLLPGWPEKLAQPKSKNNNLKNILPLSPEYYAGEIHYLKTPEDAHGFLSFAQQRAIGYGAIDTEYRFQNESFHDVRSLQPLLCSVVLAESIENQIQLYTAVFDLRIPEIIEILSQVLKLPICFVGHNLKSEFFCFWQLGLSVPPMIWDTYLAEKALYLGQFHHSYSTQQAQNEFEESEFIKEAKELKKLKFSLVETALRYGITHHQARTKTQLQQSFLHHPIEAEFSTEQIEYAAEDALVAAKLYPAQVVKASVSGILQHLTSVELPWVETNAQMIWNGVKVSHDKGQMILQQAAERKQHLENILKNRGLNNVSSHKQLLDFLLKMNLAHLFLKNGKYSFDKDNLKELSHIDPVIQQIERLKKANAISANPILNPLLVGKDGRIHCDLHQLGADTGRQTSTNPNILGIPGELRPVIIPESGYGIGEVDYCQIEPGIAGAIFNNQQLIELYNTGDVYSAMAKLFFEDSLDAGTLALPFDEFKKQQSELRKRMKVCTLGIIYGLSIPGLANKLGLQPYEAKRLLQKFMDMFPGLQQSIESSVTYSTMRGYAQTHTGLRRLRGKSGPADNKEKNWFKNYPIQGSAATVFKAAGNRLAKLYPLYQAKLLIPLHDSFVFEVPLEHLEQVAKLTEEVMCQTVREHFPQLRPQVDVNISHPECWNKEGCIDLLERWELEI